MSTVSSGLAASAVSVHFGRATALNAVDLAVPPASLVALAGPNGSGKTTLLRVLAGILTPRDGSVRLGGRDLSSLSPPSRARRIAVVPQRSDAHMLLTARQVVALGRTPHVGFLGSLRERDRDAIGRALEETDTAHLAGRTLNSLSGGEQQRVYLAAALAQEADFLLLDEPTTHLDVHHQQAFLGLLRRLRRDRELAVVAAVHDLNLAGLYFERIVVLEAGRVLLDGAGADVLRDPALADVFHAPLTVVNHPVANVPQLLLTPE